MTSSILKKLALATALLVAVWIVYVYRQVPHEEAPFAKVAKKVERIVLEQGGMTAELRQEAGSWKAGHSTGAFYAADGNLVQALVAGLQNLQLDAEMSTRADRAADYDLTLDSGMVVRLQDATGLKMAEGLFGKQAPDMAHIYFRYLDKPNVYIGRGVIRGDLGRAAVAYWRSRRLIDIPEAKFQSITTEGPGFKTELVRTSTDVWTMNGKVVETGLVDALVGTLAHLNVSEFVDPALFPQLTYESLTQARVLVKSAAASVELRIGAEDAKSKQFPVSVSPASGVAWLPESLIHSLQLKPSAFNEKK